MVPVVGGKTLPAGIVSRRTTGETMTGANRYTESCVKAVFLKTLARLGVLATRNAISLPYAVPVHL